MRVLIAEDEVIIANDIKYNLTQFGYADIILSTDGETALKYTEEHKPDIILIDIILKGKMNGIDFARLIKIHYNIPFIFITSYSDDAIIQQAKETGPSGFIIKPFKFTELHAAIEVAVFNNNLKKDLIEKQNQIEILNKKLENKYQEINKTLQDSEARFRDSEARFQDIVENLPIIVCELDTNFTITYINPYAHNNYNQFLKTGSPIFDLIPSNQHKLFKNKLNEALTNDRHRFTQVSFKSNDGHAYLFSVFVVPILRKSKITGSRCIFFNIKELIESISFPDDDFLDMYNFSKKEKEIIHSLIKLKTNFEIAKQQLVSNSTVKFHIKNIYNKFGVNNRKEFINLVHNYYSTLYGEEHYMVYIANYNNNNNNTPS